MNQQVLLRKLQKTQKAIDETVFQATAGGVVTVEVYGTKELKAVKVSDDFEAESKEDLEMLGEMIVAASNEAYKQIDKTTQEKMGKYSALAGGFGGGLF